MRAGEGIPAPVGANGRDEAGPRAQPSEARLADPPGGDDPPRRDDPPGRDGEVPGGPAPHDWRVVRTEFEQRKMGWLRRAVQARGGQVGRFAAGFAEVLAASSQIEDVEQASEELAELLLPMWNAVASRPGDCVLLAVYGYVRCQLAWELTADERIVVGIRGLRKSWERAQAPADESARLAVDLVLQHAGTLLACIRAENALKCSCPVELAQEAGLVTAESANLLARSAQLPAEWAGFRDEFLVPVLRSHELTYGSLCEVAASVSAWAEQGRAAAPALASAIATLEQAERDPSVAPDVYASELRAHRAGLRALHAHISDPQVPDLRIEHAKIVYCYPFAVPEVDGAEVCRQAAERAAECFGPSRVTDVTETELSDLWNAQGRQDAMYSGITILLPDLTVRTTGGDVLPGHAVSIRLSRLGNHYVRVERAIRAGTLHDLNQAMRRATSYMGLEVLTEQGGVGGPWRRLPEYVRDQATQLSGMLASGTRGADGAAVTWPSAIDADFHVLLEITAASVVSTDGATRPATTADVLAAVGPLARAPLQSLPTSLEEWARFDTARFDPARFGADTAAREDPGSAGVGSTPLSNLVDSSPAFPTDFVGRTFSATLVVMLDTPNWAMLGYEEHAEFVASLSPLLEGWRDELVRATEEDQGKLDLLGSEELSRRRLLLQDKVKRIQDRIALLHSLDLWKTLANRRFGENLYAAAGLHDVEAELTRTIDRVELYYERLAALIAQKEERRNRRYQTLVELILALLAVSSLAEVFGLANNLLGLQGHATARWEIGVLAGAATLVGLVVLVVYKLRD